MARIIRTRPTNRGEPRGCARTLRLSLPIAKRRSLRRWLTARAGKRAA